MIERGNVSEKGLWFHRNCLIFKEIPIKKLFLSFSWNRTTRISHLETVLIGNEFLR